MRLAKRVLVGAVVAASVSGCASRPITHVDTASGYRASIRIPKSSARSSTSMAFAVPT